MSASDVAARIRSAALACIDKQCFGEDFGFDAIPSMVAGPDGMQLVYMLVTTTPTPLLGQGPLVNVTQVMSPAPTSEQAEQAVVSAMRELRDYRAKLLSASANGSPLRR